MTVYPILLELSHSGRRRERAFSRNISEKQSDPVAKRSLVFVNVSTLNEVDGFGRVHRTEHPYTVAAKGIWVAKPWNALNGPQHPQLHVTLFTCDR